jgi:hypothetical protein
MHHRLSVVPQKEKTTKYLIRLRMPLFDRIRQHHGSFPATARKKAFHGPVPEIPAKNGCRRKKVFFSLHQLSGIDEKSIEGARYRIERRNGWKDHTQITFFQAKTEA